MNQRVALTKRMLQEAMLQLAEKKDLEQISVAELCRAADINRATFYRHYQIPRDVLTEIQKDMFYELRDGMPMPIRFEEIYPALLGLCTYLQRNKRVLQVLIRNNSDANFAAFVNTMYSEFYNMLAEIPVLRKLNEEDIRLLILYSAGGSYFILRHWMLGDIEMTPEEMTAYLYGLLNKPDWDLLYKQMNDNE